MVLQERDIVIDALTMTMSTDSNSANVTLETVRRIKAQGGRTVLGVSNISFGLPQREISHISILYNGDAGGSSSRNSKCKFTGYDAGI